MIYLDYSATTPLDPAVLKKMLPYFSREFANPASVHTPGQKALKAVDDARYDIAKILHCKATEIIFTSGATEANNLILKGIVNGSTKPHIVTTAIEHDSILEPLHALENRGVRVTYVPVNPIGLVDPETVIKALRPETALVSIGYVNSETGVIQPIKKIGRLIKKYNERRLKQWLNTPARQRGKKPQPVIFHTDATQAANFCDLNTASLHVDAMSLSAHKIYGPKGSGALYLSKSVTVAAQQHGGHQERNLRSGTLNVPAIIGFAEALTRCVAKQEQTNRTIASLRDRLVKSIRASVPTCRLNTNPAHATPSHANISFPGLEGDILLAALDKKGIAVSTGSACASGDMDASHVLVAMGLKEADARSAIRCTLGRTTTKKEIDRAAKAIVAAVQRLSR